MFFNSSYVKSSALYIVDVYSIDRRKFYQMFGKIVLDLSEGSLVRGSDESAKSLAWNTSLKTALYFYLFMAKKAYYNYKAVQKGINHSAKIDLNKFKAIFALQTKLLAEHKSSFLTVKSKAVHLNSFFRLAGLLSGGSLNESNDLFKNLYKDFRLKDFSVAAKFAKTKSLF